MSSHFFGRKKNRINDSTTTSIRCKHWKYWAVQNLHTKQNNNRKKNVKNCNVFCFLFFFCSPIEWHFDICQVICYLFQNVYRKWRTQIHRDAHCTKIFAYPKLTTVFLLSNHGNLTHIEKRCYKISTESPTDRMSTESYALTKENKMKQNGNVNRYVQAFVVNCSQIDKCMLDITA